MKLELSYPVKPLIINQKFGGNGDYYRSNGINIVGHNGIDFWAQHGQPVYATHDGISYVGHDDKEGNGVVLVTTQKYDYGESQAYFKTIYWHLLPNIPVTNGQSIKMGDLIGYADSTGFSTGDHLHFGLKPMANNEPAGSWINIEQNNGYLGAIDPLPYFNGRSAQGFHFDKDLELGDSNEDVRQLQLKLKQLGYFPLGQATTGYYGNVTKTAVHNFQLENIVGLSWKARYLHRGKYCYAQTREALNRL